jgi:sialate O-acetylesterase
MEWGMRASHDPENEIAKTSNPNVRLYTVPKLKANQPTSNVPASWLPCEPVTTAGFSAVAYYFARDLQKALGVPVGVIHTSWGGSPAEVWMREGVIASDPDYKRDILDAHAEQVKRHEQALAQWQKDKAAAESEGKKFERRRPSSAWKPAELFNGMIAPLIPYAIKGAIWYQGESNASRAHQYRRLFPDMIDNWRHDWGQGDFPFLLVQLAPFLAIRPEPTDSTWAELREAQLLSTRALPKVGMAVITDVGDEKDIHPRRKEPVGARLALSARHVAYGEKLVHSGPLYKAMKARDGKVTLSFDHVGAGLEARPLQINGTNVPNLWQEKTGRKLAGPQALTGFAIAGADQKFVWADAVIEGDKVIVSSPAVSEPAAVRYGWADFPLGNLWNKDGLPATPFRTDKFPMTTEPKTAVAASK